MTDFRGDDLIVSPAFPQLSLTAKQVFDAIV
jgi:Uma2 family endonuclease